MGERGRKLRGCERQEGSLARMFRTTLTPAWYSHQLKRPNTPKISAHRINKLVLHGLIFQSCELDETTGNRLPEGDSSTEQPDIKVCASGHSDIAAQF